MALQRGIDGSDPIEPQAVGRLAGTQELRRVGRSQRMATGTLACPECDAPVALAGRILAPRDGMSCPFCRHTAAVRDFLSLAVPSRPARVEVRVVARERRALPRT
jgi:hypothetical protein